MEKVFVIGRDCVPGSFTLGKGESLRATFIVLPGVSCSLPLEISIEGEGAEVDLKGLFLSFGSEKVDISVDLRHHCGHSESRQLFKGIASGNARCSFYGRILVDEGTQKVKALQENHNLLLSDKALIQTRPQLEIYADDVECSHGATVGRLDENELFYMRSRGIPESEARRLQMLSFISPIVSGIKDEALVEEIYSKLEI